MPPYETRLGRNEFFYVRKLKPSEFEKASSIVAKTRLEPQVEGSKNESKAKVVVLKRLKQAYRSKKGLAAGLFYDNTLVGVAVIFPLKFNDFAYEYQLLMARKMFLGFTVDNVGILMNDGIERNYRGKGGGKLLNKVREKFAKKHFKFLVGGTLKKNEVRIKLFKEEKFIQLGEITAHKKKFLLFCKKL